MIGFKLKKYRLKCRHNCSIWFSITKTFSIGGPITGSVVAAGGPAASQVLGKFLVQSVLNWITQKAEKIICQQKKISFSQVVDWETVWQIRLFLMLLAIEVLQPFAALILVNTVSIIIITNEYTIYWTRYSCC
jgi:hypothetical protein